MMDTVGYQLLKFLIERLPPGKCAILFTMAKLKSSKDLLMLLLYAADASGETAAPIQGQTRLMKMVFLFNKELKKHFKKDGAVEDAVFPEFEAYDYGPYSSQVYADLEFLVNMGFVEVDGSGAGEVSEEERSEFDYWTATGSADDDVDLTQFGKTFTLSPRGRKFVVQKLESWGISEKQLGLLKEFKTRCCEASLHNLLRYVYSRYPDMTKKSKIKNEVLR
ncbi:MAG: hypothetical protein ACFE0O_00920 [Opitutales bacterium]